MEGERLIARVLLSAGQIATMLQEIDFSGPQAYGEIHGRLQHLRQCVAGIESVCGVPAEVVEALQAIASIVRECLRCVNYAEIVIHLNRSSLGEYALMGWQALEESVQARAAGEQTIGRAHLGGVRVGDGRGLPFACGT